MRGAKKILAVAGTRPQFIKHAILSPALFHYFNLSWINTGQHYDSPMSETLIRELKIQPPDFTLETRDLAESLRLARMIEGIHQACAKFKPDFLLVYGDTDSTLAGALTANKIGIPLIHIEAGLRSRNLSMPEEVNRVITDTLSDFNFCPGFQALLNLEKAGAKGKSFVSGDVMKDLFLQKSRSIQQPPLTDPYILATLHRGFNTFEARHLNQILFHLNSAPLPVILPVHPRTARSFSEFGIDTNQYKNIRFTNPLGYGESLAYQKYADYIITDSGGIQKEAYWFQRPCITVRPETEWTETVLSGWNTIVWKHWEELRYAPKTPGSHDASLYGSGKSSEQIAEILKTI